MIVNNDGKEPDLVEIARTSQMMNKNDCVNINTNAMIVNTNENEPNLVEIARTSQMMNVNSSMIVDADENEPDECVLMNKKTWCSTNNCLVNKVTVTSKKWQWIRSKNCYGNVGSKVSKYLCKSMKSGHVESNVHPTHLSLADEINGAKLRWGEAAAT